MRFIMASDLRSRDRRWITYNASGSMIPFRITPPLPTAELADRWSPYYTGDPYPRCPISGYIYEP
tara:strand:- start:316 stop:510 length:195 start_codon:yes stop_codon:yes gene_type:complete